MTALVYSRNTREKKGGGVGASEMTSVAYPLIHRYLSGGWGIDTRRSWIYSQITLLVLLFKVLLGISRTN